VQHNRVSGQVLGVSSFLSDHMANHALEKAGSIAHTHGNYPYMGGEAPQ
jgi:hypothetical protein